MNRAGLFAYGEMGKSVLQSLIKNFTIQWVILPDPKTQTDKERQTQKFAEQNAIPIIHCSSAKELFELVSKETPDVVIIASYNKIIPEKILNLTKFINIHIGDLPNYRGRANANWAIINNKDSIVLTIHQAIPDLDAGNIFAKQIIPISRVDTIKTVYDAINTYLSQNIFQIVHEVLQGDKGVKQKGKPTYCCTRVPEDGLIDWHKTTQEIYNLVRALSYPYPGAFTYFERKKMIIWEAEIPEKPKIYKGRIPGRIGEILPGLGVEVLTGDASIIIKRIKYENKEYNASEIIKSTKKTLGINWVELYEKINKILEKYED